MPAYKDNPVNPSHITDDDLKTVVKDYEKIRGRIEKKLRTVDNIELFAQIILFKSAFNPRNFEDYNEKNKPDFLIDLDDLINSPNYLYGIGLALKNSECGTIEPSSNDYSDFLILLNDFFNEYTKSAYYKQILSKDIDEGLIASSRLHYLINQINKERYPFQTKELLTETLGDYNQFFYERLGFDINDAMNFSQKIIKNFKKNVQERLKECKTIASDKENYQTELQKILFANSKTLIEIDPIKFCERNGILEIDRFHKYIEHFSCSFGEGNQQYNLPIHDNLILERPLIKHFSKYYTIDPGLLFTHLPEMFAGFIDSEKQSYPKIWSQYLVKRKKFTETKVSSFFSRIFPEKDVHSNLFYQFKDPSPDETDHIVSFHDNILIIEDKSGRYTTPARRGGVKRIKHHLKELIEDSYVQGIRCRDYIKSKNIASFENEKHKLILNLHYDQKKTNFILINVTLEHLYNFSSVMILKSLDMFKEEEYLWSISLFDLDLITQFFSSPTIFIHYIESRLRAPVFFAFEETSFLGYYLQQGNFTVYPIDGKIPHIVINPEYITEFDLYYLNGGKKPSLTIEKEILKIIQDIERLMPENSINISNSILNLRHDSRNQLIKGIERAASKTSIDGERHDTLLYHETLKTGISVFTKIGKENLYDDLFSFCNFNLKKYKAKCWIGIGIDILDTQHFAHEFVFVGKR